MVARRVRLTRSLLKGWGFGFVMLIATYLVPNEFISFVQNKTADLIQSRFDVSKTNHILGDPEHEHSVLFLVSNIVVIAVGLAIAGLFILVEKFLLRNHKDWLDPVVKKILNIPRILE